MTTIGRPTNLQAAAVPLRRRDLRSPTRGRRLIQDPLEDRLWGYYDQVPAIGNYVQVLSNSADLVAYYPGLSDPESSEPVPVVDGPAVDVWKEIGGEAAVSEWVSSLVVHLSVPGQGWFVPLMKPNQLAELTDTGTLPSLNGDQSETVITWTVVSTADLKRLLKLPADNAIPEEDRRIWRIYTPHPRNASQPDSPVRRIQTQAQILTLIEQRRIADLHSRIHAGVWFLPSSLRNQSTVNGKTWGDVLEDGLIAAATPGALESLVPLLSYVEQQEAEAIREPIRLTLDDADKLTALQEQMLRQLAIGLDAPIELTTGIGGLNHWSAWLIQEETYSQHLDPLIVRILRSLEPWWQAQLETRRVPNVEDHVIWRNPATAINRPDSFNEAKDLHDRFVISDESLRRAADKGDEDAPDDEEIQRRIVIAQAVKTTAPTRLEQGPPTEPSIPIQAATTPDLGRLARRLTNIDGTTLGRLEREAARQLRKRRQSLLDRIQSAAKARGFDTNDPDTLPTRLGPTVVQELIPGNLSEPDDFDQTPFAAILADAQTQTAAATEQVGVSRNSEADRDDRTSAVTLLLAALSAALIGSLFGRPSAKGEQGIDGAEWVPVEALRQAMDTAGGGPAARFADDAWELIGNGRRTVQDLTRVGIETEGFQWIYGTMPRRTFEPHLNLDGFRFTRWDDPGLRQSGEGTWVGTDFYFPQDHRGCACTYIRTLVARTRELVSVG